MFRIGLGSDIHRFETGRSLVIGGVEIKHSKGLLGHSDADVVLHALADALLGAVALGDLGKFFPSDEKNKGRSSLEILRETIQMVWEKGYAVENADIVILAEEPKLAAHYPEMVKKIATVLNVETNQVSVKSTSCEKLGSIGRSEGILAQAVVLLKKKELVPPEGGREI